MELNTIYLVCAVAGGTVLVLRIILLVLGIGDGDHSDIATDVDTPDGLDDIAGHGGPGEVNFISIQSLSGFFTMFGLVGMGLLQVNVAPGWSLAGALAAGALTGWASAMIVFYLQRLQSSGTVVIANAVGQQGTVYLTVPAQGSGVVNVTVQGALRQFDAVSRDGKVIPTGSIVRVTGLSAGKLLIVVEEPVRVESVSSGG